MSGFSAHNSETTSTPQKNWKKEESFKMWKDKENWNEILCSSVSFKTVLLMSWIFYQIAFQNAAMSFHLVLFDNILGKSGESSEGQRIS